MTTLHDYAVQFDDMERYIALLEARLSEEQLMEIAEELCPGCTVASPPHAELSVGCG